MKEKELWWKYGVVYHIYPRSFYDSNNDGIGDIQGIIHKLPYLKQLGINAIWLSPIYESPQIDFGYDVSDYHAISSDYGSMNDFKSLLEIAHQLNIKIIMDMILNHTSDKHPWFIESSSSSSNPKRNWYIWKKASKNKKPNNWKNAFGKKAWALHKQTNEYYYHSFFKEQPDLNWRNKEVKNAMFKVVEFWLNLGVDGLRLDVINMIAKDKKFRNNPLFIKQLLGKKEPYTRNRPKALKIIKQLRSFVDKYNDRMLVGEIYTLPPGDSKLVSSYLGNGNNALHMAFDFSLLFAPWKAKVYTHILSKYMGCIPKHGWPCHVYSNHDLKRYYSKPFYKKQRLPIAKLKALIQLTLKGTPFIYYGDEIGMENTYIPLKKIKDPIGKIAWPFYSGRDKARTPMQWNNKENAGFSKAAPWLPVNKNFLKVNTEMQINATDSLWLVYKELITLRTHYKVLQRGNWSILPSKNKNILAYKRILNNKELLVLINFKRKSQKIAAFTSFECIFNTHTNLSIANNILLGHQGLILKAKNSIYTV